MNAKFPDFGKPTVLFGGSFDPLHLGHLELARGAVADTKVAPERVIFVPCYISPGKAQAKLSPAERLRLLAVGLEKTPYRIWDFELLRPTQSYTIETLREAHRLGATKDSLFFLVGSDSYADLGRWRESEKLRDYARILVGKRPGYRQELVHVEDRYLSTEETPLASHEIRAALETNRIPERSLPSTLEAELRRLSLNSTNPYAK